jgi:predicted phosphodiesterase
MDIDKFKKWWIEKGTPGRCITRRLLKEELNLNYGEKRVRNLIEKAKNELTTYNIRRETITRKVHDKILTFYDDDILLDYLKKEKSIEEIKRQFLVNDLQIEQRIEKLKSLYNIVELHGKFKLESCVIQSDRKINCNWDGEEIIKFGLTSDNHVGNKKQQLTFLHEVYDRFHNEGIEIVYNAGDVTDGNYKNRPEHLNELIPGVVGADEQAQYVAEVFPKRNGMKTKAIGGNHDETHIKNGGADVLKRLALLRDDFEHLGNGSAWINLTPNCSLEIIHPLDGSAYATSYSPQRYVDSLQGGDKPNIIFMGHHHKAMYFNHRNVHVLEAGTTCAQTQWMKRKKIMVNVGAWIITIHLDDEGTIRKFIPEFIPLYRMKQDDY